ncbi:MAG: 4Fe-4S dicluster domain-containing protein [Candidatus Hodarchaeota archaeon]
MVKESIINILIDKEKCTGCISCQLWCSYTHHKIFNPLKANLEIKDRYGLTPEIIFLDTCIKCGQCVQHCLYGALRLKEEDN